MDIKFNFQIIKNILDTKMMELEEIKVKLNYENQDLKVEIYDKEVFEKELTLKFSGDKKDIEIRKNKLTSLFI